MQSNTIRAVPEKRPAGFFATRPEHEWYPAQGLVLRTVPTGRDLRQDAVTVGLYAEDALGPVALVDVADRRHEFLGASKGGPSPLVPIRLGEQVFEAPSLLRTVLITGWSSDAALAGRMAADAARWVRRRCQETYPVGLFSWGRRDEITLLRVSIEEAEYLSPKTLTGTTLSLASWLQSPQRTPEYMNHWIRGFSSRIRLSGS